MLVRKFRKPKSVFTQTHKLLVNPLRIAVLEFVSRGKGTCSVISGEKRDFCVLYKESKPLVTLAIPQADPII